MSWHLTARCLTSSLSHRPSAYHSHVLCKLNDGVGVVRGHAVVSEQGVQEGTEHATQRGATVEGQHGGCAVAYPHLQLQRGVFSPRVLSALQAHH
jgi:hypothetical protein